MRILGIGFLIVLVVLAGGAGTAMATDNVYAASTTGIWHDLQKWSLGHAPYDTENAVIPSTSTCTLDTDHGNGVALSLNVQGTLVIAPNRKLTIGADDETTHYSIIDGLLTIDAGSYDARLYISGDHFITGDGGTIRLTYAGEARANDAMIMEATDGDDKLTIDGVCDSESSRDCSLSIVGQGEIRVQLDNNAYVVADGGFYEGLRLSHHEKTTTETGFWIAEDGGALYVQCKVRGAGRWWVIDVSCTQQCSNNDPGPGCNGVIIVDGTGDHEDACVSGTGPVVLKAGCPGTDNDHQLKVRGVGDFCTTGPLLWQSVNWQEGQDTRISEPAILVETGATARFGGACPQTVCP